MPKLAVDDGLAIRFAKPGDMLPDGTIAMPLTNAQPFEYDGVLQAGDSIDLVGIPFNGHPGSWVENAPGKKKQWRMYGRDGAPVVDIDFDNHHGQPNPHAHNWDAEGRDNGWPVSILP